MVSVVLTPRPFAAPQTLEQPAGRTVRAMLAEAVRAGAIDVRDLGRAELHVDGETVARDRALDHVLSEGQVVNLVVYPHGGGGGGGKDVGQVLLQIAVIAVSAWVGGGAGGAIGSQLLARVAAAAVMVGGNMALNALYAPKSRPDQANDRYALQAASNRYRQWGPMPLILGESVVAPDLAVKTFTRTIGDDVWIYGILAHHYGPCALDELKIGDTLASSLGEAAARFVHHLTPGPRSFSLVPNDIDQTDLAPEELAATTSSATPVVRAVDQAGERFEFDFFLPAGLYFQKDDGRKITASVTVTVRYRAIDAGGAPTGAWTTGLTIPLSGASRDPLRITRSLDLPMGRYEFEARRSVLEDTNEKRHTDVAWSAIRSIAFRKPVADETLSISEFAIRATALNQGTLAPITCRITPICETWTGSAWGPAVATSNPAALTRWLLTGPAPAKPLLSMQADVGLRRWSELCDEYGWTAHLPVMEERSQADVLALLERAGRAGVFWTGTEIVASPWVEKPVPKQMFTGVNLKDHRFEIVYPEPVHAFRVEFQNLDEAGEWDEINVYNDGYGETADPANGIAAATLIEAYRLEDGQKTSERAYRDARWEMGRRKHQRRIDTWSADAEAVVSRYGDRVRLSWLRVAGEGGARVRARRWSAGSGSTVVGLRLDREIEMEPGVDYVVDLRLVDQLITGVPVVNPASAGTVRTRELTFVDPRSAALSPRAKDLIAFGPAETVSEDVELVGIEPGEGLTAGLTGVRYVAPLLMAGETGTIPPLPTRLTLDRLRDPPRPTLLGVSIDEGGVRAGFSMPPWKGSPLTGFSVRWRAAAEGSAAAWVSLPDLGAGAMILTTPPLRDLPGEDDVTRVQVEVRALTASGRVSPPLTFTAAMPVVEMPSVGNWTLGVRPPDGSGVQQPGLIVTGTNVPERVASVVISWGLTSAGPWKEVYSGPPTPKGVPIDNLPPGAQVWAAVTFVSAQGVPGLMRVLGPETAPGLIAGDVAPGSPTILAMQAAIGAAEAGVGDLNTAVTSLNATIYTAGTGLLARSNAMYADINTAGTGLKAQTASLLASLNTPTTGVLARLTATESAVSSNNTAAVNRLNALEATVNTSGTGLVARMATAESAITANNTSSVNRLNALEATVNTPGTGLSARVSGLQTAVSDLNTGKANASDLTALTTRVTAAEGVNSAQNTRLNTVESDVAGKASAQSVAALEARRQGIQNLVKKSSITTGSHVLSSVSWGAAGWGVELVGNGGSVVRAFTLGPFKKDTAYSLSFKAKLTAGTSQTISIDLFPDTLPETTRVITNAEQTFAWEAISSTHEDMVGAVQIRFFRNPLPTGVTVQITDIVLVEGAVAPTGWTDAPIDNTSLLARTGAAESAIVNLQTGKADASRVTSLETTVNTPGTGLSATVGTLQSAVSDLQSGKANASDFTSLNTEVVTARGSAASLNARLNTVESNVAGKASASSVSALEASVNTPGTGLLARMGAQETATANLQTGKADASRVTSLEAKINPRPNLLANSTGANGLKGWSGAGWTASVLNDWGPGFNNTAAGTTILSSDYFDVRENTDYVLQADLRRFATAGSVNVDVQWTTSAGAHISYSSRIAASSDRDFGTAQSIAVTSPSGATKARIRLFGEGVSGATAYGARKIKFEKGALPSTPWTDDATTVSLGASIGTLETATANLQTGKADASRVTALEATVNTPGTGLLARTTSLETATANLQTGKADVSRVSTLEATVNTPGTGVTARLTNVESVAASADGTAKSIKGFVQDVNGLLSGFGSVNDGVTAQLDFLATAVRFLDPSVGERAEYRAGNWYVYSPTENTRTRYGKAFGGTQKLVWWTGPSSVAEGSETKANAYVYMSQNTVGGGRYGGSDVPSGGGTTGGAAFNMTEISGAVSSGSWVTLGSVTFTSRPASGWWDALVSSLAGLSDGFASNDVEFRIIETGASSPLASGSATVEAGMGPMLLMLDLGPAGPWAQTRPAGNLTLNIQARRASGTGTATISGNLHVNYTPSN